jgi:gliding motility-associated-like protein
MHLSNRYKFHTTILFLFLCIGYKSFSQCAPAMGAAPAASFFNTGGALPGEVDPSWKIAKDSITGIYNPAVVMLGLPAIYYHSQHWISFSTAGEHLGDHYFFYKLDFNLPCKNLCGKSYDDDNSFCLNLDLYADNSIFEIYVNGVAQSANLGNIIPLPNPFNPLNHTASDKTPVSLCRNWKAGANTIIIELASSGTVAGMMAEASVDPPPPPDANMVTATICEGSDYILGDQHLTKSGNYLQSFPKPGGCDSNVALNLVVQPTSFTEINQTICEGQTFAGYTQSGTYVDTYPAANGCDSIRKLNLAVQGKPVPDMKTRTAFCTGDSLLLSPGLFLSYLWQDGSTGDHFVVKSPGLYAVIVTNACGTTKGETLVADGICNVFFPNAFTPNRDGKNDFFRILTDLRFQQYHLSVYNRWGQKIFETADPAKGWDGNFNGKEQQAGLFIWNCTFKRSNKTTSTKGTLLLMR